MCYDPLKFILCFSICLLWLCVFFGVFGGCFGWALGLQFARCRLLCFVTLDLACFSCSFIYIAGRLPFCRTYNINILNSAATPLQGDGQREGRGERGEGGRACVCVALCYFASLFLCFSLSFLVCFLICLFVCLVASYLLLCFSFYVPSLLCLRVRLCARARGRASSTPVPCEPGRGTGPRNPPHSRRDF